MFAIPAIDLKDGRCVRLLQGRADAVTVYGDDPVAMAQRWAAEGATLLHVVDLDGAFAGRPMHAEVIARMAGAVAIPLEVGGGIRTDDDIQALLDAGVRRGILGTRACRSPQQIADTVARFGDRVAVSIDARDGQVQVNGWVETTAMRATDLAQRMEQAGVRTLIYTDTARDGMLGGPNLAAVQALCRAVGCDVIASGGVSCAADLTRLREAGCANLVGAIVGKALYEGTLRLAETGAAPGAKG